MALGAAVLAKVNMYLLQSETVLICLVELQFPSDGFRQEGAESAPSVTQSSARLDFPGRRAQFHLAHSLGKLERTQRFPDVALQGRHLEHKQKRRAEIKTKK